MAAKNRNTSLNALPDTESHLMEEARRLGLLLPNASLDTGRKKLLYFAYKSHQIKRSYKQGSIILFGPSGVGKSSTLNHLFNSKKDEASKTEWAKVGADKSETRATTEFLIQTDSKEFEVSGLKLGLVETPSIGDTGGTEQDACNLNSIKSFYEKHDALKGSYPNLIFVFLSAADTRAGGPNSQLSKALRFFNQLGLVDREHPNVVGIITFADNMIKHRARESEDRKKQVWKEAFEKKKQLFHEVILRNLGVRAKIVAIENDYDDEDLDGDGWSKLMDGTKQPLNLFKACTVLLDENKDPFGKLVFNACFEECSTPTVDKMVESKDSTKEALTAREKAWHETLQRTTKGCPFEEAANCFIDKPNTTDQERDAVIRIAAILSAYGFKKDSVKNATINQLGFLIGEMEVEAAKEFLLSLGVQDSAPNREACTRVIGRGYDILRDTTVSNEIFSLEPSKNVYGLRVPAGGKLAKVSETRQIVEFFNKKEDILCDRMKALDLNMHVEPTLFSLETRPGYNDMSQQRNSSSEEYSMLFEERIFELTLGEFDKLSVTEEFSKDVANLPVGDYDSKNEAHRSSYKHFFETWGHFVVTKAFGGGAVEFKVDKNALSTKSSDTYEIRLKFCAAINVLFSKAGGGISGSDSASTDEARILKQCNQTWKGGDDHSLQKPDSISEWKNSLIKEPVMLEHEMSLSPISDAVKKVDEEKSKSCRNALQSFLGGMLSMEDAREEREPQVQEIEKERRKAEDAVKSMEEERAQALAQAQDQARAQAQAQAREQEAQRRADEALKSMEDVKAKARKQKEAQDKEFERIKAQAQRERDEAQAQAKAREQEAQRRADAALKSMEDMKAQAQKQMQAQEKEFERIKAQAQRERDEAQAQAQAQAQVLEKERAEARKEMEEVKRLTDEANARAQREAVQEHQPKAPTVFDYLREGIRFITGCNVM